MSEKEIQEALKTIKEPITVNSIEYKYFDQENYEKLINVYEKCQWFINNTEQFIQNFKNQQKEIDRLNNIIDELEKYLQKMKNATTGKYQEAIQDTIYFLNTLKELKGE